MVGKFPTTTIKVPFKHTGWKKTEQISVPELGNSTVLKVEKTKRFWERKGRKKGVCKLQPKSSKMDQ